VGSGAVTCPTVPDLASQLRYAPALPRVLCFEPRLSAEVGSGGATCPYGLRDSSIEKRVAGLPMQLRTHVLNACTHVCKVSYVKAIMRL
jgi:hypothetical protein